MTFDVSKFDNEERVISTRPETGPITPAKSIIKNQNLLKLIQKRSSLKSDSENLPKF